MNDTEDQIPYCIHEDEPGQNCGQIAVAERLNGLSGDGTEVVERVCYDHRGGD